MHKGIKFTVYDDYLYLDKGKVAVGSADWYEWLTLVKRFSYKSHSGKFMAQSEERRNNWYWYAYRKRGGKLFKAYLGKNEELTPERLNQICLLLDGQIQTPQIELYGIQSKESRIDNSFMPMTKVNGPLLPHQLITRSRLIDQMQTPLVMIYAPSGFGKSTLINEWKQSRDYPVAWISLDENDNIPKRFWQSIVLAFKMFIPEFGQEILSYLSSAAYPVFTDAAVRLTNDIIFAQKQLPKLGLVMDDFRNIHNTEIYDSIQAWIEYFPPNMQLIISSYTRPPLSFGDVRAKGLLNEIDASDLRFTTEEGVAYLRKYLVLPTVAYVELEKLVKHTEGWASGLTLAALALGKQVDQQHFIDTFSGAHVYLREYFMETVLQHTSLDVQNFLFRTAILKHLNGSLCDAVTEQTGGEDMLSKLWKENLFITRLDKQGWYRYHDLFAEMLFSQLQARFPDEITQLHQRAAQWYRDQYSPADGIYHLLSIEAWEEAATLIEEMAFRELEQFGEDSRLLNWLQELPDNVFQRHKNLFFVYLRLSMSALPINKIEKLIQKIEFNIAIKPVSMQTQEEIEVLIQIQQIRDTWAKGKLFFPPNSSENDNDIKWNLLNKMNLLKKIYEPDAGLLEISIVDLLEEAKKQRNLFVIMLAGGVLARSAILSGQLRSGEKMANQILEQALLMRGSLPQTASISLAALCQLYLERNEIGKAQKYLEQAVDIDPNPVSTNIPVLTAILRAKIQAAQWQIDEAVATMRAVRNLHMQKPSGVWLDSDLVAYECLFIIRSGNFDMAQNILAEAKKSSDSCLLQLVEAKILLNKNEFEAAEKILADLLNKNPLALVTEPMMAFRVLHSFALFGQYKVNQAIEILINAVLESTPERFLRPFLEAGMVIVPLLLLVLKMENVSSDAKNFIREALQLLDPEGIVSSFPKEQVDAFAIYASISSREQDVLQFICEGYPNKKIAEKLCLSESTVKTHVRHIYTKLKVDSRIQLIVRAKEFNLVK